MEQELQISPGTESIMRASFAKGFYYNDKSSLIRCVEGLISYDNRGKMRDTLLRFRGMESRMDEIKEQLSASAAGELYLTIKSRAALRSELRKISCEAERMKTILTGFVITTMEKAKLLQGEFTMLKLTKLPLTLKGTASMEEQSEDIEMEEDYEEI